MKCVVAYPTSRHCFPPHITFFSPNHLPPWSFQPHPSLFSMYNCTWKPRFIDDDNNIINIFAILYRHIMMFLSDAVDELLTEASTVIGPAVIAAAVYRRKRWERGGYQQSVRFAQQRERIPIIGVYNTMGPRIFRRAFRMTLDGFWRLHSILLPHIWTAINRNRDYQRKGGRDPIPNGPISPSIRLGAALHYFAGRSAYDIVCVFGIAYSEVLSSVWTVVEAINQCSQ